METQETNNRLNDIMNLRTYFMRKRWELTKVTKFKTKVEVSFYNNESDFRETSYPNEDVAMDDQVKKLKRDIKSEIGVDSFELLKELINE